MKHTLSCMLIVALTCLMDGQHADGWGHGGSRGGGGWGGGGWRGGGGWGGDRFGGGGWGGDRVGGDRFNSDSWGGDRSDSWGDRSYSGWRSGESYSGWRSAGATSSYDRSWTGSHGGSVNVEGDRGAV